MGALLVPRYQEIASFIEELSLPSPSGITATYNPTLIGTATFEEFTFKTILPRSVRDSVTNVGFKTEVFSSGWDAAYDVWSLQQLLIQGDITTAEAEAFLSQKYPDQQWSGGEWGGQNQAVAEQTAIDKAQDAAASGEEQSPIETAELAREDVTATGLQGEPDVPPAESQVFLDELPFEYEPEVIQASIESALEQVMLTLTGVSKGRIRFQPNSIPGTSIAPGTLPATAIRLQELQQRVASVQRFDQAVRLTLARATGLDTGLDGGAGRVWRVNRPSVPRGWRPSLGFSRYRLLESGQRFGVSALSFELENVASPTFVQLRAEYGIIITGIPHFFGRPPIGILDAHFVGDAPVPFTAASTTGSDPTTWGAGPRLFHDRADADFRTDPAPFMDPFGSGLFTPDAADIAKAQGLQVSLITGRTPGEVYEQVNSLRPDYTHGHWIAPSGHGPSRLIPDRGFDTPQRLSFTTAGVTELVGLGPITPHARGETDSITWNKVAQAGPLSYSDCAALVPNASTFSVFVRIPGLYHEEQALTGGTPATWDTPAQYPDQGVRLAGGDGRTWGVDIVVY